MVWRFHTIPPPGEPGYESWKDKDAYNSDGIGGANNWGGMALDETLGLVYVPTGSVPPDFYGGARRGSNLFANCLLAMDAATGIYLTILFGCSYRNANMEPAMIS
ncbi:hypothetical protein OO010_04980 [Flavobacteriaceae bacterium KMM 6898]|nr:hypothetical protein [Flavobacteriaceae bacterium KMM 6898]